MCVVHLSVFICVLPPLFGEIKIKIYITCIFPSFFRVVGCIVIWLVCRNLLLLVQQKEKSHSESALLIS